MLHIKLKGINKCSSMVASILPADPFLTLLFGSKGQNTTFSEHDHVAYQIKGNQQMQQYGSKYFAGRPLPDPAVWGRKVKIQLFQNMIMFHIKLKGITKCSSMVANISTVLLYSKGQNKTFSEHGHASYQIKENHECSNMVESIWPADPPPDPRGQ